MTRITRKTIKLSSGEMRAPTQIATSAAIVVLQGAPADIGVHRLIDRPIIVGRGPGVDLALLDERLAQRHCIFVPHEQSVVLQDLRSQNGTMLNDRRVDNAARLHEGDHIFVGGTILKFSARGGAELRYHASMDERVGTDDLTGLLARHRFEGALVRAVEACAAGRQPLGALMLDLDGIKQINDTHGHLMGAHVIAEAGRVIGRIISPHGAATRLSGDEFAGFMPRRDLRSTLETAELVVRMIQEHRFQKDSIVVHPTISIGVAMFPDDTRTPWDLLARADEALLRAKRGGRNRVSI